jgi:hypothetical protein
MEEFYQQGDREKKSNMPVSNFMDREHPNISKCQLSFIEFFVLPLYHSWDCFVGDQEKTQHLFHNLDMNIQYFQSRPPSTAFFA